MPVILYALGLELGLTLTRSWHSGLLSSRNPSPNHENDIAIAFFDSPLAARFGEL